MQLGNKTECALLGYVKELGQSYDAIREEYTEEKLHKVRATTPSERSTPRRSAIREVLRDSVVNVYQSILSPQRAVTSM